MKEFEFHCDDVNNINDIARKLFVEMEETDPSSIHYNRQLNYPLINWKHIVLYITGAVLLFIFTIYIFFKIELGIPLSIILSSVILAVYILFNLKKLLICLIEMYQQFAPKSMRMACRFEPSCSQYMILAIQKYGSFKGVMLGIKRLKRCKIGNGGYDFP